MELTDNIRAVIKFYSSLSKSEAFCKLKHYNGNTEEYIYSRLERAAFDQARWKQYCYLFKVCYMGR